MRPRKQQPGASRPTRSVLRARPAMALAGLLLLAALAQPGAAQTQPTLTLATILARFEGHPFEASDYRVELLEYDPETGTPSPALTLWGPNALAYPNQITGLAWSPDGVRLALTWQDRDERATLALYDVAAEALTTLIPASEQWARLSAPRWASDGEALWLSGTRAEESRVLRVEVSSGTLTPLDAGAWPVLLDDRRLVYWQAGALILRDLSTDTPRTLAENIPPLTDLVAAPDGDRLAYLVPDGGVFSLALDAPTPQRLYASPPDARLTSLLWSEASLLFIENSPPQTSRVLLAHPDPAEARIRTLLDILPDNARALTAIALQPQGAFIPPRDDGNTL